MCKICGGAITTPSCEIVYSLSGNSSEQADRKRKVVSGIGKLVGIHRTSGPRPTSATISHRRKTPNETSATPPWEVGTLLSLLLLNRPLPWLRPKLRCHCRWPPFMSTNTSTSTSTSTITNTSRLRLTSSPRRGIKSPRPASTAPCPTSPALTCAHARDVSRRASSASKGVGRGGTLGLKRSRDLVRRLILLQSPSCLACPCCRPRGLVFFAFFSYFLVPYLSGWKFCASSPFPS